MTREATTKLLEMVEEGVLEPYKVILSCVNYMSEAEVADMCRREEFFDIEEDEEDEDDEDD